MKLPHVMDLFNLCLIPFRKKKVIEIEKGGDGHSPTVTVEPWKPYGSQFPRFHGSRFHGSAVEP